MPADLPPSPRSPGGDPRPRLTRNARNGLWLFAAYVLLYAGFVGLSALRPHVMATTPLGGVNLAILYGFGLIAAALLVALVYMTLSHGSGEESASGDESAGGARTDPR